MKKEFNIIANLIKENSKVLDVGCGDGELMKYITENITVVIKVVIRNFFAILGFFGAPGSIPSIFSLKISLSDWIPIGSTEKKIIHQIIT